MERFLIKSKKQMLLVIGVFTLVMLVGTVTYAFFNYTRTGASNTIRVGRIAFNTNQTQTINLTNAFPITVTKDSNGHITNEAGFDTFEITITGDTDYSGGVEYLVSTANTNITTSGGKQVPVSIDVIANNLGTENSNYFTARDSATSSMYKRLIGGTIVGDQMVLVGYIVPNNPVGTQAGINGTLTIKAYLDDSLIGISDTYDGTESDNMGTTNAWAEGKTIFTTTEWSNLQLSFKVKVEANEGIWVNNTLDNIIRTKNLNTTTNRPILDNVPSEFVTASTGIDFSKISGDTNGKGVYMRAGTENMPYPIVYYRGAVDNNNVVFANKCWKAVRTTDTGGVKLVYNGELSYNKRVLERSEYGELVTNTGNYTFDTTNNSWNATMTEVVSYDTPLEMSFNLPVGNYFYEISGTAPSDNMVWVDFLINNNDISNGFGRDSGPISGYGLINVSASTDIVSIKFYADEVRTSSNPSNVIIKILKEEESLGLSCDKRERDTFIDISRGNQFNPNYNSPAYVGYMYGDVYEYKTGLKSGTYWSDVDYVGGVYTLKTGGTTSGSLSNTHHYICEDSSSCTKVRYYYHQSGGNSYYIELENGDTIATALAKMQENNTSSNAKTLIDNWYQSNMTTVTNKLEDTIWCNDRSIYQINGWNANGGNLSEYLYYGAYGRRESGTPSLKCSNKNDAFTVKNGLGNQKLTYPVSLLTSDEVMLAGGQKAKNDKYYLYTGINYWLSSPLYFSSITADEFDVSGDGHLTYDYVNYPGAGLRPSVSLKPGMAVSSGDGSSVNPYVID